MRLLVEAIQSTVTQMNYVLDTEVYYDYGSFKELQKKLVDKSKEQITRYPLIFLMLDIDEAMEQEGKTLSASTQRLYIFNSTNREWSSQQRTEQNYKPVLYPLYELFISTIKESVYFTDSLDEFNNLPHRRKDKYFYSVSDAKDQNVLAAYLDAIEITDMEIKLNQELCLPGYPSPILKITAITTQDGRAITTEDNRVLILQ